MKSILSPAVITLILMWGPCSSAVAEPAKLKQVEEQTVIQFSEGTTGRPSFLKTIKGRFDSPNTPIGVLQKGWSCSPSGNILWNFKTYNLFSPGLPRVFRAELEKARYPVPKISDAIFDEPKDKTKSSTDLQVGALIKEVNANFCVKNDGVMGGVYMKVFWQVYAPEIQKVVFETITEGAYQREEIEKVLPNKFFEQAFAMAVRGILAEQGFYNVVANPITADAKQKNQETLRIKTTKISGEPISKDITNLRSAVVTVFGDSTSGSGFFISQNGHLLTNHHVVGNARFIKVRLTTGRDLVGEVIRSDKARDVALVKTEPIAVKPISLRESEPNIGEEVYAIGSPLGDKFNTTLTRGILSGYRTLDGKRYLQSDVAILPGNSGGPLLDTKGAVVGISVSGLGARGIAGMNFFIPVREAISKMDIELH